MSDKSKLAQAVEAARGHPDPERDIPLMNQVAKVLKTTNSERQVVRDPSVCRAPSIEESHDRLMLRSVGAMTIAEGDEGWQGVPLDCPMLGAVAKLRTDYDALLSQVERLQKRVAELEALTSWTHTDDVAVNRFCVAMIEKLTKKREQGYSGWDDPQECTLGMLAKMLIDHISKGDPVDIANFCMMVWTRGETDEDHAPAVQAIQTAALVAAITAKAIP